MTTINYLKLLLPLYGILEGYNLSKERRFTYDNNTFFYLFTAAYHAVILALVVVYTTLLLTYIN